MSVNNGLSNRPRLTQTAYRTAVSSTVASLRNGYTDQDMADMWGVSAGTVNNAQNHKHDLGALPLLMLADRFGPGALNTVLNLVGAKAVHDGDVVIDVGKVPHKVASTLPLLIELLTDGVCCDHDIRKLEDAGAIDLFCDLADMLRQRRDGVRLKAVSA